MRGVERGGEGGRSCRRGDTVRTSIGRQAKEVHGGLYQGSRVEKPV